MIEDVLAELAAGGYIVSNTFQVSESDPKNPFGAPGWQVYLRNERNTRTGSGVGRTLGEAFEVALRAAERVPLQLIRQRPPPSATPTLPRRALYVPAGPTSTTEETEELF